MRPFCCQAKRLVDVALAGDDPLLGDDAGAAVAVASLTGIDLDGFLHGDEREVFVLSIDAIVAELTRMAPRP